jgi:hypothetical protein
VETKNEQTATTGIVKQVSHYNNTDEVSDMSDNIDDVAFDRWFFPFIPVLLRNRELENKCFVNAILQALKACPAIRNYVFANLRGKSLIENCPVDEV